MAIILLIIILIILIILITVFLLIPFCLLYDRCITFQAGDRCRWNSTDRKNDWWLEESCSPPIRPKPRCQPLDHHFNQFKNSMRHRLFGSIYYLTFFQVVAGAIIPICEPFLTIKPLYILIFVTVDICDGHKKVVLFLLIPKSFSYSREFGKSTNNSKIILVTKFEKVNRGKNGTEVWQVKLQTRRWW